MEWLTEWIDTTFIATPMDAFILWIILGVFMICCCYREYIISLYRRGSIKSKEQKKSVSKKRKSADT